MTKSKEEKISIGEVKTLISGKVGKQAELAIVNNLNESATALMACQGISPENLGATEATIVIFVVDKSGSMSGVEDQVEASLKESVKAMEESKQAQALTLTLYYFDEVVNLEFANRPVEEIIPSDISYRAGNMTALYDATLDALTGALGYEEMLLNAGVSTKVILVVFSDGDDNSSRHGAFSDVKKITDEIRKRENWILAFVGFKTGPVDYNEVAKEMGFPTVKVIDLNKGEYGIRHAIRETFRLVSKSVIRASQTQIDPNKTSKDFFNI